MTEDDITFLRKNFGSISIIQNDSLFLKILVLGHEAGDAFEDYLAEELDLEYSWLDRPKEDWTFVFESPSEQTRAKIVQGIKALSPAEQ